MAEDALDVMSDVEDQLTKLEGALGNLSKTLTTEYNTFENINGAAYEGLEILRDLENQKAEAEKTLKTFAANAKKAKAKFEQAAKALGTLDNQLKDLAAQVSACSKYIKTVKNSKVKAIMAAEQKQLDSKLKKLQDGLARQQGKAQGLPKLAVP